MWIVTISRFGMNNVCRDVVCLNMEVRVRNFRGGIRNV